MVIFAGFTISKLDSDIAIFGVTKPVKRLSFLRGKTCTIFIKTKTVKL